MSTYDRIYRYTYQESELVPFLAVYLDPVALKESIDFLGWLDPATGELSSVPGALCVLGDRYFLVIDRTGDRVTLSPTYSKWSVGRQRVVGKAGHPGWVGKDTFIDPRERWVCRAPAVIAAAERAFDRSAPSCRNCLSVAGSADLQRILASAA